MNSSLSFRISPPFVLYFLIYVNGILVIDSNCGIDGSSIAHISHIFSVGDLRAARHSLDGLILS